MRKIKFRLVWKTKNPSGVIIADNLSVDNIHEEIDSSPPYDAIEQFTGLLDKNGKEIYEGDIVKGWNGHLHTIKYSIIGDTAGQFAYGDNIEMDYSRHMEVIGNVWENKELSNDT